MRVPAPPVPILSQNAAWLAYFVDGDVFFGRLPTAPTHQLTLPFRPRHLALSPAGTYLAVAGSEQLHLFQTDSPASPVLTQPLPGPSQKLAVTDAGWVVAVARLNDRETTICSATVAGGSARDPFGQAERSITTLQLDGPGQRLLIAGTIIDELFVQMLTAAGDELWSGAGAPPLPSGYLFPLQDGVGAFQRDRLFLIAPTTEQGRAFSFDNLETVAASPTGRYIAWFWGRGPGIVAQMKVASLVTGLVVGQASLPDLGHWPTVAVNDAGRPTLAFSRNDGSVAVWSAPHQPE